MDPIIKIENLCKTFDVPGGHHVKALENINLDIYPGEIYGIIGLSGAGKSTLVRCINYLEIPTSGDVIFEGKSLRAMSEKERRTTRQSMGMIFQGFNLLAQRNILDNVRFPLELMDVDKKTSTDRARELLKIVGLGDRENAYPSQLSGGQKQRVAIARAIASNPKVLLCDEATSALDPNTTKQILDLLKDINTKFGITVIIITHEMKVIESICDKVAIIDHSNIVESGYVKDIFKDPKSEIGQQLIIGNTAEGDKVFWRKGGNGNKIRLAFTDITANEPVVSNMILASGCPVNILFADFKTIRGDDYGQMVLELPEDPEGERKCRAYLDSLGITYEEVRDNAV